MNYTRKQYTENNKLLLYEVYTVYEVARNTYTTLTNIYKW